MNPCTTYEIKMLINSLPNKTSSGHDDISNKLLKEICEPLVPALDYIVNESLKGSCLGPLIFLIFCNDLSLHLQFLECIQFTDNTTLVYSHANKHYLRFCVMEDLSSIQDWFYANKLTLNLSKTVYLFFEHKCHTNIDLDLTLNAVTIPRKRHTKFLGVWVDDQLNWKHHIQILTT